MVYIIETPNPFEPFRSRKHTHTGGITIRGWLEEAYPGFEEFEVPTICVVNGEPVKREGWNQEIKDGAVVNFIAVPGEPATIALVSLIVSITFAVLAVGVAIYLALTAPKSGRDPESDPVFSTKGQHNEIRLGEPIEDPYGRNRIYPSFAARPYFQYIDNDQFQYGLLCLGHGQYAIDTIQIGDTDIDLFQEVEYQVVEPGGTVTLFPTNVVTSVETGGQTLFAPNEDEYVAPGWVGPFPTNPAGTEATQIQVDLVFPKGIYVVLRSGRLVEVEIEVEIEFRSIDDLGNPVGAWTAFGGSPITIAGMTTTPQRRTYSGAVSPNRYEMRARRVDTKQLSHRAGHDVVWEGMRAFIDVDDQDYGDVTLLAVKIRATNNLNERTQQRFNVIATRKLPIRDSGSWTAPVATRSIVWAFVDAFKALYGGRVTDEFFDWAALETLDALYTSRGEYFDWIFRDPITVWDAAKTIARVGRAIPILNGSEISMTRNGPAELPVAFFSPSNMTEGSFQWEVKLWDLDEHDSVRIEYTDPDTNYKQETVVCTLPGGTTDNPEDVRIVGIQSRAHAYREGIFLRAQQFYLRENISFETGLEGYIPSFGDLIAIAHDMPRWGQSGFIVHAEQGSGTDYHLWLSEPLLWSPGASHQILLRGRQGQVIGPLTAFQKTDPMQVMIQYASTIDFLLGGRNEPMIFIFGITGSITKYGRAVKIEPHGGERIRIVAVNDAPVIHTFDALPVPALGQLAYPPSVPDLPTIATLTLSQIDSSLQIIQASWSAAVGAQYYVVQTSEDNIDWQERGTTVRTSIQLQVRAGPLWVRVAGVNVGQGAWITATTTVLMLLGLENHILWDNDTLWGIRWTGVLDAAGYRVKVFDTTGSDPILERTTDLPFETREFSYTLADATADANLNREMQVTVDVLVDDPDTGGVVEFGEPVSLDLSNPIPSPPGSPASVLQALDSDGVVYRLSWTVPAENDLIRLKIWLEPVTGFDPAVETPVYDETFSVGWENIPTFADVEISVDSNYEHAVHYWRAAMFDAWGSEIASNVTAEQVIAAYP